MIYIKDTSGNIRFSTPINDGSKRKFTLQKEDYITLKFSLEKPIYFKLGDYVDDSRFGLFEVCDIQKPTYNNSTGGYDYDLRLDAYYWKWKNKIFKYTPEVGGQESSWSLTADLNSQMGILVRNLKALGYRYKGKDFEVVIDSTVENKSLSMTYDNINILDACFEMAKKWKCECWMIGNIIHFGRCEYGDSVNFELGKNVETMTRSDSQTNFTTRIYAFGSTRNIPTSYRPVDESIVVNGIVQKRLMLPVGIPYIDAYPNMSIEEAVEDVVVFDDIYPRRTGTVSDITTHEYTDKIEEEGKEPVFKKWNAYRFKDAGITFSKDYVLKNQELEITFQSGALNGMKFAVTFNPCDKEGGETLIPEKNADDTWNPLAQVWEIVRNEDYGRPLPGDSLIPKNGDTYILSGFDTKLVSDTMIPAAENELKEKACKYIEKSKIDPSTYTCKMMSDSMVNEDGTSKLFEAGDKVNLINAAYFEKGNRLSRIIGFEYNLDIPYDSPVYTVGETASYSRLGDIEGKLENLTYKGQTYTGNGNGVYVIGTNDSTPPSNRNVFSALKSLSSFLRKDRPDRTNYIVGLDAGATFGEYVPGTLGSGAAVSINSNGDSEAEFDFLKIRKKATFTDITVQELKNIGGELVVSPAGMVCSKVESVTGGYKCYFEKKNSDGKSVYQQFVVGDQARCQTFNLIKNKYYWRLVTAIGDDYIVLSDADKDGTDIPEAEDNISQLGNRDNIERQNAQIISAFGPDAPSFKQYAGINSYSLVGKQKTVLSPTGNELSGKVTIEAGSIGAQNLTDLPDEVLKSINTSDLQYGKSNLLRNSGFTGDFLSKQLEDSTNIKNNSEMFNPSLKHWEVINSVAQISEESESGYECVISNGSISQNMIYKIIGGESYIVSFKGKGNSISFSVGGYTHQIQLKETYERKIHKFISLSEGSIFALSGTGCICELQLERGTLPSSWGNSPLDNTSELAYYQSLQFITSAIKEGKTGILGGLVLASQLQLGNFANGEMTKVTSGVSGIYNNDTDVSYWAGGTFQQATKAAYTYFDNPEYTPTEEELSGMANAVITHGGRAILNDVILRGYIYALGGSFKGHVEAQSGSFRGHVEAESGSFKGDVRADTGRFGMLEVVGSDLVGYKTLEDGTEEVSARITVNNIPSDSQAYIYDPVTTYVPFIKEQGGITISPLSPSTYRFAWEAEMRGKYTGSIPLYFETRGGGAKLRLSFGDLNRFTGVNLSYSVHRATIDSMGNLVPSQSFSAGTLDGREVIVVGLPRASQYAIYVYFENTLDSTGFASIEYEIEVGTPQTGTTIGANGIKCAYGSRKFKFTKDEGLLSMVDDFGFRTDPVKGVQWTSNAGFTWKNVQ